MQSQVDPSSNSTVIFCFSVVALLMISINTPTCLCDDDLQYTNCNAGFACEGSDISKFLKYPFWGGNREAYCSGVSFYIYNHEMQLACDGGVPKITLYEIKYRILDWDNTTQMLTVARDDYWAADLGDYSDGDVCGVTDNYKNSTFDNTQFQLVDKNASVKLLYNCSNTNGNQFGNVTCAYNAYGGGGGGGGNTTVVYTVDDPSSVPCSPSVIVMIPIMEHQVSQITSTEDLAYAIDYGFKLRYTGTHFAECGRCVVSGGACGTNFSTIGTEFACFCKDGPQRSTCISQNPTTSSKWKLQPWKLRLIVIGASVAGFGIIIFSIVAMSQRGIGGQKWIFWRRIKFVDHNDKAFKQRYDMIVAKRYNSAQLKSITKSFRDKLGDGGFAIVYKGCLPDGRDVAVKVIRESKGNEEDFINEVASISSTSHRNIVSLLGFCYEMNERALIFEFMPKGSLDKFIYRSGFPNAICDFDWNILFQIAIGIARGLEYLHQGCASRILHLDIKPQNILLDDDFCPKISDFGLAKMCKKKESIVSILGTRGTPGYIAPEVFSKAFGRVSDKSDVYSYGMLILEIIGGRNNHDTGGSRSSEMYFPDWIYKDLEQGNTHVTWLAISEEENEMVRKIIMVSLWCIQTNPLDRLSMKKVLELLEGPLRSVPFPPKPLLHSPEIAPLQISSMYSGAFYETNSITT